MTLPMAGISGCGDAQTGLGSDVGTDRYARRFLPFRAQWIRESEIPKRPQKSPWMVIWEVSEFDPHVAPTPEQTAAAKDLVERCYQAALDNGWFDHPKGMQDGFLLKAHDKRHYRNDEYVLDGIMLDPERPEYLMYYPTKDGGEALAGFMFLADAPKSRGPQIGGPLTVWHYHVWRRPRCFVQELLTAGHVEEDGECKEGLPNHRGPEMMHVWLIDHPRGAFSSGMMLPGDILERGIEKRMRERGY